MTEARPADLALLERVKSGVSRDGGNRPAVVVSAFPVKQRSGLAGETR